MYANIRIVYQYWLLSEFGFKLSLVITIINKEYLVTYVGMLLLYIIVLL